MNNQYSIELRGNLSGSVFSASSDQEAIEKARKMYGCHEIRYIFRIENNKEIYVWSSK